MIAALELHELIARSIVLYYAALGAWGMVLALRRAPVDPAYRGALAIGLGIAVVEVLIGVALLLTGGRAVDDLHYLYGLSILATLPLARLYLVRSMPAPLAYALGSFFMMGLSMRGVTTGG